MQNVSNARKNDTIPAFGLTSVSGAELTAIEGGAVLTTKTSTSTGGGCTQPGGGIIPLPLRPVVAVA